MRVDKKALKMIMDDNARLTAQLKEVERVSEMRRSELQDIGKREKIERRLNDAVVERMSGFASDLEGQLRTLDQLTTGIMAILHHQGVDMAVFSKNSPHDQRRQIIQGLAPNQRTMVKTYLEIQDVREELFNQLLARVGRIYRAIIAAKEELSR